MARKQADGLKGYFASISMQDGSQIKCRLKKWVVSDLKVCINCSLAPSTLYNLQCSHKLCQACFNKHACYVCPMDNTRSQQYETSPFCTFNSGLLKTTMECPFCGTLHKFSKLQEHLKTRHPEIAPMMQPSRPENKLAIEPNAIRPPPGFPGHVSPVGRGRGLLFNDVNAYPTGYEECDHQQVLNSAELASFCTGHENMEIEETPQATNQPAGDESPEREDQPTPGLICIYCAVFVKSDEQKEHLKYCLRLFLEWKELILNKVFHDCQESEPDWNSEYFDHADNCPKLVVCKKCSNRVLAKDYVRHLDDQCPAKKQTCTSSQVDEDKDEISTKPACYGAQSRAHDLEEGALPCPYCQTPWENKDLQEHIKNCQLDRFEALNSPSGKMNGYQPVNALLQESKPDTRSIKEIKEDHAKPKETEDDVEALKKRVEELEQRIENLEHPLRRLLERLRNNE